MQAELVPEELSEQARTVIGRVLADLYGWLALHYGLDLYGTLCDVGISYGISDNGGFDEEDGEWWEEPIFVSVQLGDQDAYALCDATAGSYIDQAAYMWSQLRENLSSMALAYEQARQRTERGDVK